MMTVLVQEALANKSGIWGENAKCSLCHC